MHWFSRQEICTVSVLHLPLPFWPWMYFNLTPHVLSSLPYSNSPLSLLGSILPFVNKKFQSVCLHLGLMNFWWYTHIGLCHYKISASIAFKYLTTCDSTIHSIYYEMIPEVKSTGNTSQWCWHLSFILDPGQILDWWRSGEKRGRFQTETELWAKA